MKVKIPELIHPEILYERNIKFEDMHPDELTDLLQGLETALDIVCKRFEGNEFSIMEYELMFYRGDYEAGDFIGKDFMAGGINLASRKTKRYPVLGFQTDYRKLFKKVQEDFSKRPGSLNLDALIVGFRDSITHEVDALDPFQEKPE